MRRSRVKDWLLGALGMLLVLVAAVVVLWWVATDPDDGAGAGPGPSPATDAAPAPEPPADLREDESWFAQLSLDAGTVVTAGSVLRDVSVVGQDVITRPDAIVAERAAVQATVPFEVVAEELGDDTTVLAADDGQVMVVRTVEVLGRDLRVNATGTVEVEDGRLVVEPRSIDVGGPVSFSEAIATAVRQLVTIEHDIEGLPEGLVLQDVTVQDDGFRADLLGEDVELVQ